MDFAIRKSTKSIEANDQLDNEEKDIDMDAEVSQPKDPMDN